ncbi:MAG: Xaa-Pro peptidase family protein [Alphaproteobacteria bacterium]
MARNPRMDDVCLTGLAKNVQDVGLKDFESQIDMAALRQGRLARAQQALRAANCPAMVLYDPVNVRYCTGTRQMQVYSLQNPHRYAFVPAEGKPVMFEFGASGAQWVARQITDTVGEVRPGIGWDYFASGPSKAVKVRRWGGEIAELMAQVAPGDKRIAFDRLDPEGTDLLRGMGFEIVDGQEIMHRARVYKTPEEILCLALSVQVCEIGFARIREALKPGMTEMALWSILNQTNLELGGEWIFTRLLTSGGRTNPWFQEAGEKRIRPGELIACDSDMTGPFGYVSDISRTFFCGPGRPTAQQKKMYTDAYDLLHHNIQLMQVGRTWRDICDSTWRLPDDYLANRYTVLHGTGLADEQPFVFNFEDRDRLPDPDGVCQPGMALCIEAYIGPENGPEGVKLEQQIITTEAGPQLLSTFPFEEDLLN